MCTFDAGLLHCVYHVFPVHDEQESAGKNSVAHASTLLDLHLRSIQSKDFMNTIVILEKREMIQVKMNEMNKALHSLVE